MNLFRVLIYAFLGLCALALVFWGVTVLLGDWPAVRVAALVVLGLVALYFLAVMVRKGDVP
jgi:hypothetical protein